MLKSHRFYRELAAPIIKSDAFQRLKNITFLGILSPKYKSFGGFPIKFGEHLDSGAQETRAHHSLNVAKLAVALANKLQLSQEAQSYALVWGLLHDIATWPLSHTGEAGFSKLTGLKSSELRAMIISGGDKIQRSLSLFGDLKSCGIQHDKLLSLFEKDFQGHDDDFRILHKLLHSRITPDALEGMYRSGRAFNIRIPEPTLFIEMLERDLFYGIRIEPDHSNLIFQFWRAKSKIYASYINTDRSIEYESRWAKSIEDACAKITLRESLEISEKDLVGRVSSRGIQKTSEIRKYKEPLNYIIMDDLSRRIKFADGVPIDYLADVFLKEQK